MGNGASIDFRHKGNAAYLNEQFQQSITCYTKAIEEDPHDPRLYSNRAASLFKLKRYTQSLQDARVAISLKPDWAKGYYRAALALRKLNRPQEALEDLMKAQAVEPDDPSVAALIADLQATSDAHPAAVLGNGSLLTWGRGAYGMLGSGNCKDSAIPTAVAEFRDKQVLDVSCGLLHAVAVTVTGETYAWGMNKQHQCGVNHNEDVLAPRIVPSLLGKSVRAVACGGGHTIVITDDGAAYSWGVGGQGQLGHGNFNARETPTRIETLVKHRVKAAAVCCGMGHSFILDSTRMECFAFGWNNTGQLGLGHTRHVTRPTAIKPFMHGIQHLACGGGHSCLVLEDGSVYTTGCGAVGQLGHGNDKDISSFTQIKSLAGTKIALTACGEEFTCLVTANHAVLTFGLGNVGQLGNGALDSVSEPTLVTGLAGKQVELLGCTQGQVVAITKNGDAYSWGMPGDQVTVPDPAVHAVPKQLDIFKRRKILRLECGRQFYCAVIRSASAPNCRVKPFPATLVAGQHLEVSVQAMDMFDEPVGQGGDRFCVSVVHAWDDRVSVPIDLEDKADGTYTTSVCMTVGGSYTLYITLGGHHLPGSPFNVDVQPGPVDIDSSTVNRVDDDGLPLEWARPVYDAATLTARTSGSGSGTPPNSAGAGAGGSPGGEGDDMVEDVVAGEEVLFDVSLKDSCRNPCHSDAVLQRVVGVCSGPSAPPVCVAAVESLSDIIDSYASIPKAPIGGVTASATVTALFGSGARLVMPGSGGAGGAGGAGAGAGAGIRSSNDRSMSFRNQTRPRATSGAGMEVGRAVSSTNIMASANREHDVFRRSATLRNFGSTGSAPSRVSRSTRSGLARATWGSQSVQDALSAQARAHQAVVAENERRVIANVTFSVCGEHTVRFFVDAAPSEPIKEVDEDRHQDEQAAAGGLHKNRLQLGERIYKFRVRPAAVVPAFCVVHPVPELFAPGSLNGYRTEIQAVCGDPCAVAVACFDKYGNPTRRGVDLEASLGGPDNLMCRVVAAADAAKERKRALPADVAARTCEWVIEFLPIVAGTYSLTIDNAGVPVAASPYTVVVSPGPADALFSTLRDQDKASLVSPPSAGQLAVTCVAGSMPASPGGFGPGYTAAGSGQDGVAHLLAATGRNASLTTTPTLTSAAWHVMVEGDSMKHSLALEARDAWGNNVSRGGDSIAAWLQLQEHGTLVAAEPVQTEDHGNGTYGVTYTLKKAGHYVLYVVLNNCPLAGSPFHIVAQQTAKPIPNEEAEQLVREEAARLSAELAEDSAVVKQEAAKEKAEKDRRAKVLKLHQMSKQAEQEAAAREAARQKRAARHSKETAQRHQSRRSRVDDEKRRQAMAKLRAEETTRRRAQEAAARAAREAQADAARQRQKANVKRTGGGFVVRFDGSREKA